MLRCPSSPRGQPVGTGQAARRRALRVVPGQAAVKPRSSEGEEETGAGFRPTALLLLLEANV